MHSVGSIFCVCQDDIQLEFFSFVTFDSQDHLHFCHVFKAEDVVGVPLCCCFGGLVVRAVAGVVFVGLLGFLVVLLMVFVVGCDIQL